MRSDGRLLRWARVGGALIMTAALGISGCSMTGSDAAWIGGSGDLEGTVTSNRGITLTGIEVQLWTSTGTSDSQTEYNSVTDVWGLYLFEGVELETGYTDEQPCTIYINRTQDDETAIDPEYGTYWTTTTVEKNQMKTISMSIMEIEDGPGDPESMFDE